MSVYSSIFLDIPWCPNQEKNLDLINKYMDLKYRIRFTKLPDGIYHAYRADYFREDEFEKMIKSIDWGYKDDYRDETKTFGFRKYFLSLVSFVVLNENGDGFSNYKFDCPIKFIGVKK